ncbi:hypothetical protein D3C72_2599440 [compost metagenome]
MDDAHQRQAVDLQASKDLVHITTRVHDNGFLGQGVADQRAVALQGADGEGFADES